MPRSSTPTVELLKFPGLCSGRSSVHPKEDGVRSFASHNDLGLHFIERGWIHMLTANGYHYELRAGRLSVFWGAVPHKIDAYEPGTIIHGLVCPMASFLHWSLPGDFTRQLMRGRVFFEPDANEGPHDLVRLNRWHREIDAADPGLKKIALMDLQVRLMRLARSCPSPPRMKRVAPHGGSPLAERMLLLIAEHFREPLLPRDVAAAFGHDPDYTGKVFRRAMGISLSGYISECRVSHAKGLLATTDAKVLEVARESGFGSACQFHAVFKRLAGCTPRAFRTSVRRA